MWIFAVRGGVFCVSSSFSATRTVTVWFPAPAAGVSVIHDVVFEALQFPEAWMVKDVSPPPAAIASGV